MTRDETEKAILRFRDRMYKKPGGCKINPVSIVAFALFGANFGYPTCCILYFCELAWDGVLPPKESQLDERVYCPSCLEKRLEATDGRRLD